MPTDRPQLLINLVSGESPIGFMRFAPGEQVAPLTVGHDAHWPVRAEGVGRVHLSLRFDGAQLFVATAGPELRAYINGSAIDGRWWRVEAPAELRFGQACLRIAFDNPSARPAGPGLGRNIGELPPLQARAGGSKTSLDGGGQWDIHHRSDAPPAGHRTQMYDPTAVPGARRGPIVREAPQPAIVPAPMVSPSPIVPAPMVSPPEVAPAQRPSPIAPAPAAWTAPAPVPVASPLPTLTPDVDAVEDQPLASTMRRPIARTPAGVDPYAGSPAPPIGQAGYPAQPGQGYGPPPQGYGPPPGQGYAAPPAQPGYVGHAAPPMQPGYVGHAVPPVQPGYGGAPVGPGGYMGPAGRPPSGGPPPGGMTTPSGVDPRFPSGAPTNVSQRPADDEPIPPPPGTSGGILASWRSISLAKKITAVLLPLAFIGVLLPEPEPPPNAPATVRALPSAPLGAGATSATPLAQGAAPSGSAATASSSGATAAAAGPASSTKAAAPTAASAAPPAAPRAPAVASGALAATAVGSAVPQVAAPSPEPRAPSSDAPSARATDANERAALDAAFAGRWQEAAHLYDRLAAVHPDEPTFRDAARIIRETKFQPK